MRTLQESQDKNSLLMPGTQVQYLVQEVSTDHGAVEPMPQLLSSCSRACEPQLPSLHAATTETHVPRACALQREATSVRNPGTAVKSSPHSPRKEKGYTKQ